MIFQPPRHQAEFGGGAPLIDGGEKRRSQLYKIGVLCEKTRAVAAEPHQIGTSWGRRYGHVARGIKLGQAQKSGRAPAELRLDQSQTRAPRSRARRSEPQPTPWREGARGRRKELRRDRGFVGDRGTEKALLKISRGLGTHFRKRACFRACAAGAHGHEACV